MTNPIAAAQAQLRTVLDKAFAGAFPEKELPAYVVEIPKDLSHGDFAANLAMVSAKLLGLPPRKIAEALQGALCLENSFFEKCEIAGPGFLNFTMGQGWFAYALNAALTEKDYGRSDYGNGQKIMVEFVSANPTGPMHMGNARGGAIGDSLAAALDWAGYAVTREFYINDAGNQIDKFALSLEARYLQLYKGEDAVAFPEDGYQGEDIKERAKEFSEIHGNIYVDAGEAERRKALVDYALPRNIESLRSDLSRYRIDYDVWFSESTLHQSGAIAQVVELLGERGMTYEKDGAVWYKATAFGAEKDEVLIRANQNPTYFAADIAYHYNKFAIRGFDRVINVWGADHHGHVARLKGAMDAVGLSGEKLDIVLMQFVRLLQDGEPVRMSKRTGKVITLTDLLDEIPMDAARFFFNMREPNSTLDFDLDLAVQQNSQNPVYYVQYAHARICSMVKKLAGEYGITATDVGEKDFLLLTGETEREVIRQLALLPSEVIMAAKNYDPARLTRYLTDLATIFHKFYTGSKIREDAPELAKARVALCLAVQKTLHSLLLLLKIEAPETMYKDEVQ